MYVSTSLYYVSFYILHGIYNTNNILHLYKFLITHLKELGPPKCKCYGSVRQNNPAALSGLAQVKHT